MCKIIYFGHTPQEYEQLGGAKLGLKEGVTQVGHTQS